MTCEEVVRLTNVWAHYDSEPVLEEVSLTIRHRDFLGIIGPNGGGKTTLLKVILGLMRPTRGEVKVLGDNPVRSRHLVGYVPQHGLFDQDFPISAWDVVLMGRLRRAGLFKRFSGDDKKAAVQALKMVGMHDQAERQIGKLSGGEQQRVLVARALTTEPRLLLLDEPTASVDAITRTEFYELMAELKQTITIVLVSHDLSAVSSYVDKIACLNRRLFYHNSKEIAPEELYATYQCPVDMIAHGIPHRILREHQED